MGIETATHINDLVATNPLSSDLVATTDDHLRLMKTVIKTDVGSLYGSTNTIEFYSGTNPQTFYAYNTRTDASNYERGRFSWNGTQLIIGTEALGTGTSRGMSLSAATVTLTTGGVSRWTVDASGHLVSGSTGYIQTTPVTVASLPAGNAGARAQVTDATVTTFASIVAGGGANKVPVYHDGSNWRIG